MLLISRENDDFGTMPWRINLGRTLRPVALFFCLGIPAARPFEHGTALRLQAPAARSALVMMPTITTVAQGLADELRARADASPRQQYWVGIAGGAGSGKSTLARAVGDALGHDIAIVLPMDGFHLTKAQLELLCDPAQARARRGAPFTFDGRSFVERVAALRASGAGAWPSFDHAVGDPVEGDLRLESEMRIVIVEGSYLLLDERPWSDARPSFDETWFVSVPESLARARVANRNAQAWGWPLERAYAQVDANDVPNMRVVAECAAMATRIIHGEEITWD